MMRNPLSTRGAMAASANLAAALLLGGCAALQSVHSDVSTFGSWPAQRSAGGYAFDHLPSQQTMPDRIAALEQAARPALESAGFHPAGADAAADVLVQVTASTSPVAYEIWDGPLWWRRPGIAIGTYAGGPYWSFGTQYVSPRYDREVTILIRDRASGNTLYEAHASHRNGIGGGSGIDQALFAAALMDFPRSGPNPRAVRVPLPQ